MTENFVKLREKYRQQIRKKQLQQQFQASRKHWKIQQLKNEQIQFYKMREQITQDNYPQYIPLILNCCYNDSINFMLLPFVPYIYEDLIKGSNAQSNLIILESMSEFQEIELPQTEELVSIFMDSLSERCKVTLNIISNLLENHRYKQFLRDLLLQAGFMQRCEEIIKSFTEELNGVSKKDLNYLYFSICCKFVNSHPTVEYQQMQEIAQSMMQHIAGDQQKYQLFRTLCQLSQSFKPSEQIAKLLYQLFIKMIMEDYIQYQEEITQFIIYCIRSQIIIDPSLQKLVVDTLQSHKKGAREKALTIIQLQIKRSLVFDKKYVYKDYEQMELLTKLSNLYVNSERLIKIQCLQCFHLFARQIVLDKSKPKYLKNLISFVSQSLNSNDSDLIDISLKILLTVVRTIYEQQLKQSQAFAFLEQQNIQTILVNVGKNTSEQRNNIIQQVLQLMGL